MRSAPASELKGLLAVLGGFALLGTGLSACWSSASNNKSDGGTDAAKADVVASDVTSRGDTAADVLADARVDTGQDLPPIDVPNPLCQGVSPTTDYSDPYVIANFDDYSSATFSSLGGASPSPVSGGTYFSDALVQDVSAANWHLSGTVAGDEHFGIFWMCSLPTTSGGCLLDVSRFKGIRFTVKGNAGPDNAMTLSLGRAENDPVSANAGCGSCVEPASNDAGTGDYCRGPRAIFPVPNDGVAHTVTILWTDFSDGSPHDSIDPHQITGILWLFHPPAPALAGDGGADASDGARDAVTSSDGASDGALMSVDDGGADADSDASGDGAPGVPGYAADITIDDIQLVAY